MGARVCSMWLNVRNVTEAEFRRHGGQRWTAQNVDVVQYNDRTVILEGVMDAAGIGLAFSEQFMRPKRRMSGVSCPPLGVRVKKGRRLAPNTNRVSVVASPMIIGLAHTPIQRREKNLRLGSLQLGENECAAEPAIYDGTGAWMYLDSGQFKIGTANRLYTMGVRNRVCPAGWRMPTAAANCVCTSGAAEEGESGDGRGGVGGAPRREKLKAVMAGFMKDSNPQGPLPIMTAWMISHDGGGEPFHGAYVKYSGAGAMGPRLTLCRCLVWSGSRWAQCR